MKIETKNIFKAYPLKGIYYTSEGAPTDWNETQMDPEIGKLLNDDRVAWSEDPNRDFVDDRFHHETFDKLQDWAKKWLVANFPEGAAFGICIVPDAWLKKFGSIEPICVTSEDIKSFKTFDGYPIFIGQNYYDINGNPWNVRGFKPGSEGNIIASDMDGNTKFDLQSSKLYYNKPIYTKDGYLIKHSDRLYDAETGIEYIVTGIHYNNKKSATITGVESGCDAFYDKVFTPGQLVYRPPASDKNGKILKPGYKVYWVEERTNWPRTNLQWPYGKGKLIKELNWVADDSEPDKGHWEVIVELKKASDEVYKPYPISPDKLVCQPTKDMIKYRFDSIVNSDIEVEKLTPNIKSELEEVFKLAINFNKKNAEDTCAQAEEVDEVTQKYNDYYAAQEYEIDEADI